MAPFVMTEKAYEIAEKSQNIIKNLHLIGECDANGNLLTDISASNFSSNAPEKPAEKPKEPVKKEEVDPLTIEDGPDLIDFDEKTLKETADEQKETTGGPGGVISADPAGVTESGVSGNPLPSDKPGGAKKPGPKKGAKKKDI